MKKSLQLFVVLLFVIIANQSKAQGNYCPPNIDFESGTFLNWNCFSGAATTGTIGFPSVLVYPAIPNGPDVLQHVMKSNGVDTFGMFPTVCNFISGNHFSVKIGDDLVNANSSRVSYKVNIPTTDNNYSLTFYYAIVFQNPKHGIEAQPKFSVAIIDSSSGTNQSLCSNFSIVQPTFGSLPGFVYSTISSFDSVYYKPWAATTLDLSGMAGKTIYIQFDAADCSYGGHFGYAYVDLPMNCSNSHVTQNVNCISSSTAELVALAGYGAYEWYDSSFTNLLSTNDTLPISLSPLDTFYHYCVMKPFNNWGCNDTVKIKYNSNASVVADFNYPSSYCTNSPLYFTDNSQLNIGGMYVKKWNWNFGDMNSTPNNPNSDTTQNPTHQYSALGSYTVCLIAQSNLNCLWDTICKTITINRQAPLSTLNFTKDSVCGLTDTTTIYPTNIGQIGNSYQWVLDASTLLISGSLTSNAPIVVKFKTIGNHTITLNTVPSPLDTSCITTTSTQIFVKGMGPLAYISGFDSVCSNTPFQLMVNNIPSSSGPSSVNCTTLSSITVGTGNSTVAQNPTIFYGFFTEQKIQMLYTKSELNGHGLYGGIISQLSWNVITKNSTQPYQGYTIKIAPVSYSIFSGNFDTSAQFTTVYSNSLYNSALGVNLFPLTTPFAWDGNSNLLIQICFDNGTNNWSGADYVAKSDLGTGVNRCLYAFSDNDPLTACNTYYDGNTVYPAPFTTNANDRPDVTFYYCNAASFAVNTTFNWTSTSGTISSTNSILDSINTVQTYTVAVNDNGCIGTSSHSVTLASNYNINIVKNLCGGSVFQFNGKSYTNNGIYYDTVHSSNSCDTAFVLDLTFNYNYSQSTITTCSPYFFNNQWLTISGGYTDTIASTNGCDTIASVWLNMLPNDTTIYDKICMNTPYLFINKYYSTAGVYYITDTVGNCILNDTLVLTNAFSTPITISQTGNNLIAHSATLPSTQFYEWIDCNSANSNISLDSIFQPFYPSSYAVVISYMGCIDTSACFNYVPTCYANFITDFDTSINTFIITIDTITAQQAVSYFWDFGDGTTTTAALPTHHYAIDSIYLLCLKVKTANNDSCIFCHYIGKDSLGNIIKSGGFNINIKSPFSGLTTINNSSLSSLLIYPNPATQLIVISHQSLVNTIEVTDVLGRVLLRDEASNQQINNSSTQQIQLDVSSLPNGIYFIKATDTNGNISVGKFVKE